MRRINNKDILAITLLSIEERETAENNIPPLDDGWWLRSPCGKYAVACVHPDGSVWALCGGIADLIGVRPALCFNPKSVNLQIGEKAQYAGRTWTYVEEGMLLCDEIICKMPFREDWEAKDGNDYEASDVKTFLDEWLKNAKVFQGRPPQ